MRNLSTELKVGLLILSGLFIIVLSSVVVTGWRPGQGSTYSLYVSFENVAGLLAGSPVQVAGVKIGQVRGIELQGNRARLELAIQTRFRVHQDAQAAIRSLGVLGDKYVELTLGSDGQPQLVHGDTVTHTLTGSDLDSLIINLGNILNDVRSVTTALSATLGGEKGQARLETIMTDIAKTTRDLSRITDVTNQQIEGILKNLTGFTGVLDRIGRENEGNIKSSLADLAEITKQLKELAVQNRENLDRTFTNLDTFTQALAKDGPQITSDLRGLLAENRQSLNSTISNLDRSFKKLDQTMTNLQSVTDKMDKGQGTIGKLLNDETTVDQLNGALVVVNRYLTDLDRIKLDIGAQTQYLVNQDAYKSSLNIYIQPLKDRYYQLAITDNPRGTARVTTTTTQTTGGGTVTQKETKVTDELELSLILAQRYFDTVLKAGLMESKFGFGMDQYFGRTDQYRIGLDVWDFSNPLGPHLTLTGFWRFYSNAYIIMGGDDLISNESKFRDAFFGVGLRFNEDSLKPLASSLPLTNIR